MRPGNEGELILEGATEAAVVVELMAEVARESSPELAATVLESFDPHIELKRMGRIAFLSSRVKDKLGVSDNTEFTVHNPAEALLVAEAISVSSISMTSLFMPLPNFVTNAVSRHGFMRNRVSKYFVETRPPEFLQ